MTSEQQPFYIGRYKVTGQLGSGGMGVVYLATDERLNRRVAIKRLLQNPNSSTAHRRIRQEALLLAQLNHSNIVQIYDVVDEDNDIALVMEYVEGSTLDHWQRERCPTLLQKLQLLRQICGGLARAHGLGIIHRDLKADNILIDRANTAKITDFGIAKNWREDSDLTREQHVAGSWGAMSPEQALGQPLDNRCDLFALGVLAYRLLCGQNPFGDSESPFVTVDRIVNSAHPPAATINPDLPAPLCKLLDQLLSKKPDARPVNAAAVCDELDAILQQLDRSTANSVSATVTITAESYLQSQRVRGSRRKLWLGGTAAMVAALVIGASATLLPKTATTAAGQYIAIVNPDMDSLQSPKARMQLSNVLSAVKQGLANREGLLLVPYSESQHLAGQPLRSQAQALNADLLLHPSLTCNRGQCETNLDLIDADSLAVVASRSTLLEMDESSESRARMLQQINRLLPGHPPRDSGAAFSLSDADYQRYLQLFEKRDIDTNLPQHLAELEDLQRRTPTFTPLYLLFSELVIDNRFVSRSMAGIERLERFLEQAPGSLADHPDLLTARLRLAIYREDRKAGGKLLEQLKLSLTDSANYYYLTAAFHQQLGDYDQALEAIDRALALRESYFHLVQKALVLSALGEMDTAKPLLLQVIAQSDNNVGAISLLAANELDSGRPQETVRLLGTLDQENLSSLDIYNLCLAHYIERQFIQADQCFASLAEQLPDDAETLLYRAEIANAQRQPERARVFAEQALAIVEGRDDWEGLLMQARAHAELGQAAPAIEKLIQLDREAPDDIYVNFARAQVYVTTGDLFSAKAHLRKTLDLGLSPIWFGTAPFAPVCQQPVFADLREDYPGLCTKPNKPSVMAQK